MIPKTLLTLLVFVSLLGTAMAEEPARETPKASGWGHVSGQVILDAELDDPRLKEYFEDLPLARPLTLPVPLGAEPELVHKIPNRRLIVDAKTKGVKNAFVFLANRPERVHPSYVKETPVPVKLTFAERQFRPRVFSLQVGQPLEMISDEMGGEATNFRGFFSRNENFNILVPADGKPRKWTPAKPEPGRIPSRLDSSIFTTGAAYCLIKDHPYVALTDREGRFELKHLPAGTRELVIWHEATGWVAKSLMVTVKPEKMETLKANKITPELLLR